MVTKVKAVAAIRQLEVDLVVTPPSQVVVSSTPSTVAVTRSRPVTCTNMGEQVCKRSRLSSPMSPHAIANFRDPPDVSAIADSSVSDGNSDVESDSDYEFEEVESSESGSEFGELMENAVVPDCSLEFNLLVSEKSFATFIRENFICKKCNSPIKERNITTVRIGCACNVYWNCYSKNCVATGTILSRQSTTDVSGTFRKKKQDLLAFLGDYNINRQVVLACQQSGGGA